MMKIERILVPVDFSAASLVALRNAADLATAFRAQLEILHVVEAVTYAPMIGPSIDLDRLREQHERAARDRLGRLQAGFRKKRLRCRADLRVGAAASTIVDVARRGSTDLIVMATHGRQGVGRWLLGSVAQRVIRTATCPVLTVRSDGSKSAARSRRALKIRRILAPTDFSELSDRGVKHAADLGRRLGAEVILFHAVEPIVMAADPSAAAATIQALDQMERFARQTLSRSVATLAKRGLRCRAMLANGAAAGSIVDTADRLRVDLIVTSTHGRSGFSRLFMGSVAERVVRTSGRPVLTVPSKESATAKRR